ncbi:hypothetical protein ACFLQX_01230 [Bacteroidota bacterium]
MKRIRRITLVTAALALIVSWSCERYEDFTRLGDLSTEMEFEPSVVAPLAYGSFTLKDVLEAIDSTGLVSEYEDSLLYIYYTDTAYSVSAADMIDLPDQVTSETYVKSDIEIPGWAGGDGQTFVFTKTEKLNFEIEADDQIDSILLKSGNLNIIVSSDFKHTGNLTITSSQITKPNGDTLVLPFPISQVDGLFYSEENHDMSDYTFEMVEENDTAYLYLHFTLTLEKETGVGVSVGEEAEILMSFEDMDYSHIYGYVAERPVLDVSQTIDVALYEAVASIVDVYFKDPQFNLYVDNSYGVPLSIDLSMIEARSTLEGTTTPLVFDDPLDAEFRIDAPTVEQLGQTITTVHYINSETSNIDEILVSSPDKIDFNIKASTGSPLAGGSQNFVLDTSKMHIITELVLPMWLQTGGYMLEDTMALDLASVIGNLSMVERAELTINMTNELPLEVRFQGYFMDTITNIVYDSLFDEGTLAFLESAPVDAEGNLVRSLLEEYSLVIELTAEEFDNISNANALWFKADASTTDNGLTYVKFYSHYELSYQVSMAADFSINTSELELPQTTK